MISCVGGLHQPFYPKFKNANEFKGPTVHTALWNHTISFDGKRVGIIGSGASAIQSLPEIIKNTNSKSVVQFQRTAPFIIPRLDITYPKIFNISMGLVIIKLIIIFVNSEIFDIFYNAFFNNDF